jgi:uncharacterized protein YndB with AHSA1/START domain
VSDFTLSVELPHPPAALFRFLAEPRNRPLWQGSLRGVADVDDGEPRPGMRWHDVTKVGVRPSMEIVELTPYRVLTETGTWRGVDARLEMRFTKTSVGTRLDIDGHIGGHGPYAVAAAVSGRLAPETIRKDLLRASAVLPR